MYDAKFYLVRDVKLAMSFAPTYMLTQYLMAQLSLIDLMFEASIAKQNISPCNEQVDDFGNVGRRQEAVPELGGKIRIKILVGLVLEFHQNCNNQRCWWCNAPGPQQRYRIINFFKKFQM